MPPPFRKKKLLSLAIATAAAFSIQCISCAESATVTGKVSCSGSSVGITLDIDGELNASTVESVSRLFDQYHKQQATAKATKCDDRASREAVPDFSAQGSHFGINSRGGDVAAAMAIGRMLRAENAWLGVNGVCFSACVLVLAGAVDRKIENAKVGIHRPYYLGIPGTQADADRVKQAYAIKLQDLRSYLREMNVSQRLADDMFGTEPADNRILTVEELRKYRLFGVDPSEQQRRAVLNEARDLEEAKRLGLDRPEFIRRQILGGSACLLTPAGVEVTDYWEFFDCKQRVLKTGQR